MVQKMENGRSHIDGWYERDRRTMRSRDVVFSDAEMERYGIRYVINAEISATEVDVAGRMNAIVRQGLSVSDRDVPVDDMDLYRSASHTRAMFVDSVVKTVRDKETGEMNALRVISGVVFRDEWCMNRFVMKNVDASQTHIFPRLAN